MADNTNPEIGNASFYDDDAGSDTTIFEEDILADVTPDLIEEDRLAQYANWATRFEPIFTVWRAMIRVQNRERPVETEDELNGEWEHVIDCLDDTPGLQKLLTKRYDENNYPWKPFLSKRLHQGWEMRFTYVIMQRRGILNGGFDGFVFGKGKKPEEFYDDVKEVLDGHIFKGKAWGEEFEDSFRIAQNVCDGIRTKD